MPKVVSAEKLVFYNQQHNLKRRQVRKRLQLAGGISAGRSATGLGLTNLEAELIKLHNRLAQQYPQAPSLETLVLESLAQKDVVEAFLDILIAVSKTKLAKYI